MKVTNLSVHLLQDQATHAVVKQTAIREPGKPGFTAININVPVFTPGNQPENRLKQIAVEQAIKALKRPFRRSKCTPSSPSALHVGF